jgi:hypothetical protein
MAYKISFIKMKRGGVIGTPALSILMLVFVLFIFTACSEKPAGPECVNADDWGDMIDKTISINPKNQYTYSGLYIGGGLPLHITEGGEVDLCPNITSHKIDPSIKGWQDSGVAVSKGAKINIVVSGSYKDRNGTQTYGSGLYAYIAPSGMTAADAANGNWWYGADYSSSKSAPQSNRLALNADGSCHPSPADPTKCNKFFELYDNGTSGEGGGYSGYVPADGHLYFRYARTADARGLSNSGDGDSRYSPWKGAYRWIGGDGRISRCDACRQTTINLACISSALFYPICVAAWQAGCAGTGHLERSPLSDWGNYQESQCQEWYQSPGAEYRTSDYWGVDGYDHWVQENYYNSYSSSDNHYNDPDSSLGYTVTISSGCPGIYGKYMNMIIGTSSASLLPVTVQKSCPESAGASCAVGATGCSLTNDGCVMATDAAGNQVYNAAYSFSGSGTYDMDSSGNTLPAGFTQRGKYNRNGSVATPTDSGAPASGELWFQILDNSTNSNNMFNGANAAPSDGNYYNDNIGSYKLHIKTIKVDTGIAGFLNNIIVPMRKIIFGYCRETAYVGSVGNANQGDSEHSKNTNSLLSSHISAATEATCPSPHKTPQLDASGNQLMQPDTNEPIQVLVGWQPGITQRMFNIVVNSSSYIHIVQAALVLVIVFYGFFFMMGMTDDVQNEVLKRIIRLALVTTLISPYSWEFFDKYFFELFVGGIDTLISMIAGSFMGTGGGLNGLSHASIGGNPFAFIDGTITMFFNGHAFIKLIGLLGLMFSNPTALIYFMVILVGLFYFVEAIISAAVLYVLCMIALSLIMIVGPIYMIFMLFEHTQNYFKRWVKMLISFTLQPVLVFTALSIFNVFIYSALYQLLHYRVCWQPLVKTTIVGTPLPVNMFYFYAPDTLSSGWSSMPKAMFMILIFIIIAEAMRKFVDLMARIGGHLAIASDGTALGGAKAMKIIKDFTNRVVGTSKYTAKNSAMNAASAAKVGASVAKRAAVSAAYMSGRGGQ